MIFLSLLLHVCVCGVCVCGVVCVCGAYGVVCVVWCGVCVWCDVCVWCGVCVCVWYVWIVLVLFMCNCILFYGHV